MGTLSNYTLTRVLLEFQQQLQDEILNMSLIVKKLCSVFLTEENQYSKRSSLSGQQFIRAVRLFCKDTTAVQIVPVKVHYMSATSLAFSLARYSSVVK